MNAEIVGSGYADHLTDADLELLATVSQGLAEPARAAGAWLRRHPDQIPGLIGDPRAFEAVFGPGDPAPRAALASPFLIFAVAVHRAAPALASMEPRPQRPRPRQRLPPFDAPRLRALLGSAPPP